MPQLDDSNVKRMLANGDPGGLTLAFSLYGHRLKQTIKLRLDQRLRGRLDESDVMQEAFLAAVRELPTYASTASVSVFVWLHRLTTRRLTDLHREHLDAGRRTVRRESASLNGVQRSDPAGSDWMMSDLLAESVTSPSNELLRKERQQHILESLQKMEENDREVLILRHFEMLSNDETATLLDLSKTAASNRYVRALQRLNSIMAEVLEMS